MSNIRILAENLADTAQLGGSPGFNPSFPAKYMKLSSRYKSTRTQDTSNQSILVDWGGADQLINSVVLAGHNLTQWSTVRCRLYTELNQSGGVAYDSGEVSQSTFRSTGDALGYYDSHFFLSSDTFAKSILIDIVDPYNTDGYLSFRRLFISKALIPGINVAKGVDVTINDDTVLQRTQSGSLYPQTKSTYRTLSAAFPYLTDTESVRWFSQLINVSRKQDVYVSVFPSNGEKLKTHSFMAKVDGPATFVASFKQAKTLQLNFVEA